MNPVNRPWMNVAIVLSAIGCAVALAGCPKLSDGEKDPGNPNMTFQSAQAMCTDGTNLYLTEGVASPLGTVKSVDLSGPRSTVVAEGLAHPTCIMTDGLHLYWLENDAAPYGAVRSSRLDGMEPVTLAPAIDSPHAIAINTTYVFFADKRNGVTVVNRVPKAGGETTTLATLADDFATTLVADESWVYFTAPYDLPNGFISRVPVDGGGAEPVITGLGTPTAMALSGNTLCYTEMYGGQVGCVQDVTAGWTPTVLTSKENINFGSCPGLLVLDNGAVYYAVSSSATNDAIRMVIPGYAPVTVATTVMFSTIKGMVILGAKIYWLESDSIYRTDKGF